jgi:broad specificity phosphatase PhoE
MNVLSSLMFLVLAASAALPAAAADADADGHAVVDHDQLVILVRHAEKALDQGSDPGLTEAGQARARHLGTLLGDAAVGAIITTEWQRTRLTAAPLAAARGIEPVVVATAAGEARQHPQRVADTVRAQPADVVVVVGHSNTVPEIVRALGGPATGEISDADYGNLFLLWRRDGKVSLVKARY